MCLILLSINCYSVCAQIPEKIKSEYGADFQNAFKFQSEGMSTHAMYYFEQGCMKAMKAGEFPNKIEAIRHLFVWYRTYGYFLGLMTKDPLICGQYAGGGKYSCNYGPPRTTLNYGTNPEREGKVRDYLFGVTEMLSGVLCIWLGPLPYKAVGVGMVIDGGQRVWDAGNSLWIERDISLLELNKRIEELKAAAM